MALIGNIGDTMECGTYYAKDQKMIVLQIDYTNNKCYNNFMIE